MNADVGCVARTLAAVMDEERASVVVTYDENGFYGHPDHIMANVVTRAAISNWPRARCVLYYPVAPKGVLEEFVAGARRRASSSRPGS
jgi:LmbE family N-acetylglucosaminyl deacetylase